MKKEQKEPFVLACYVTSLRLAKDVCFAMAIPPEAHDVSVTEVEGHGWHIDVTCHSPYVPDQVRRILGKDKSAKVNWL